MLTELPQALMSPFSEQGMETETLEIEIVDKRNIRRAPVSAAPLKPMGASVTMTLDDWVETDKTIWELHSLIEVALMQRDEAHEALTALELEKQLMATRLREWKTYARGIEKRLHKAQLRNVELVYGLRAIADIARQAITAPVFSFGLKDQLLERFNRVAEELG